jgi:hypothetical protein
MDGEKEFQESFDKIQKDLDEIQKVLNEEDKPNRLKKIYLGIISIFMLLLMITYVLPGYHLFYILSGQIVSTKVIDYKANLKFGGSVIFDPQVYETLKTYYLANQKTEFKICLLGDKADNNYYVSDLYIPKTYSQTFQSVRAELCNEETIITLHTHPFLRCIFSNQDIRSYKVFKTVNPNGISGLMCSEDRFTFYGY